MHIACSSLCFARVNLDKATQAMLELDFSKYDLHLFEESLHVKPSEILKDPGRVAERLQSFNGIFPAALSLHLPDTSPSEGEALFRATCKLARLLIIPLLTLTRYPGMAGSETPLADQVKVLRPYDQIAQAEGIQLCLPTWMHTPAETVASAKKLVESLPRLGLTLDPSHLMVGPNKNEPFDQLVPLSRHIYLRDTGPGPNQFQVQVGKGQMDYSRIITPLERLRFKGLLTIDIRQIPDGPFPVEPEIRKLKFLLESML